MTYFSLIDDVGIKRNGGNEIDFTSLSVQTSFFNARRISGFTDLECVAIPTSATTTTIRLEGNYNDIIQYNFCCYDMEIDDLNKRYYAHIIDVSYFSQTVVNIELEINVFQTFMFDYEVKDAFILREHKDRFTKNNLPIIDTITEPFNVGTDYVIKSREKITPEQNINYDSRMQIIEMVVKKPFSNQTPYSNTDRTTWSNLSRGFTQGGITFGFYVYLLPTLTTSNLTRYQSTNSSNTNVSIWGSDLYSYLIDDPNVISVRILPYMPTIFTVNGNTLTFSGSWTASSSTDNADTIRVVTCNNGTDYPALKSVGGYAINLVTNSNANALKTIGSINRTDVQSNLTSVRRSIEIAPQIENEPKLSAYPYTYMQLTDYQCEPLVIKTENLPTDTEYGNSLINYTSSIDYELKRKYSVDNYLGETTAQKDNAIINNTDSDLPLKTDAFLTYLASRKASATTGIAVNTGIALGTLALGALTGGVGLVAGIGGAVAIGQRGLNEFLTREDLKQQPDALKSRGNNTAFDALDDNLLLTKTIKQVKPQYIERLFNSFMRRGYQSNRYGAPNTSTRYYYNYVQATELVISGSMPEAIKDKIVQMYHNGVTFWHYRNASTWRGVGVYDMENLEMSLL